MGITLCPKHGRSGIAHVCLHIRSAVIASVPVEGYECWKCKIFDCEWLHWFCSDCFYALREAGLPDSGFLCVDDDEALLERVMRQVEKSNDAVCFTCLNECTGYDLT